MTANNNRERKVNDDNNKSDGNRNYNYILYNELIRRKNIKQSKCGILSPYPTTISSLFSSSSNVSLRHKNSVTLVSVPHFTGIADRLIGITTLFLFSVASNRKFQIADHYGLHNFNTSFHDTFHINWYRPPEPEWVMIPLAKDKQDEYDKSKYIKANYYMFNGLTDNRDFLTKQSTYDILKNHTYPEYSTIFTSLNHGLSVDIFNFNFTKNIIKQTGLNNYTAFGCVIDYLFTPKLEIFDSIWPQVERMLNIPNTTYYSPTGIMNIAIQIRVGDQAFKDGIHNGHNTKERFNMNGFTPYFQCAQQIETFYLNNLSMTFNLKPHELPKVYWFLFTDSHKLRTRALKKYGYVFII